MRASSRFNAAVRLRSGARVAAVCGLAICGMLVPLTVNRTTAAGTPLLMRYPDVHEDKLVFSCAGNLWTASVRGGQAKRLTTGPGPDFFGKFSPDGKWIAFTGQRTGHNQVYVISADGGEPRQLTHYPEDVNQVLDWTPDGKRIVFASSRSGPGFTPRFFEIDREGGWPRPLPLAEGASLSFSPDGGKIAFTRIYADSAAWKRYKGGQAADVWIYEFASDKLKRITDWKGIDRHPMWNGDEVLFVADRTGTLNLYRYDTRTSETTQLTDFKDWDVMWPSLGPQGTVVFERTGRLHRLDLASRQITTLDVTVPYTRPAEPVDAAAQIETISLGREKRAIVTARGEVFDRSPRASRKTSRGRRARERDAVLSPDGTRVAYISDETGVEEIYVADLDGKARVQVTEGHDWIIRRPVWSPDSAKLAFVDYDRHLNYVDIQSKNMVVVDESDQTLVQEHRWSPDGQWLAYTKSSASSFRQSICITCQPSAPAGSRTIATRIGTRCSARMARRCTRFRAVISSRG